MAYEGAIAAARYVVQEASLETLLTSPRFFGLVTATPLQRALCRIIDGVPLGDLALHPHVLEALGLPPWFEGNPCNWLGRPREVSIVAGIRGAKSLLAACVAVRLSQTVDVEHVGRGDLPVLPIVSVKMELATAIYDHLAGHVQEMPLLRSILVRPPANGEVVLRHPSGKPVRVVIAAGKRAGASLVSRWTAGALFDEFPRMAGEEAVVSWDEQKKAVAERILPNGLILNIGSPHAPFGPAYEQVQEHHGKPSRSLVVLRAPAYRLNPRWWTPERCAEAKETNPDVYVTDVEAQFATSTASFLSDLDIDKCTRATADDLAPEDDLHYCAAIDPATRGNAWTLIVMTRRGDHRSIALAREWVGSRTAPLDPSVVCAEIARLIEPYRVRTVYSDQHLGDALVACARLTGFSLVPWTMTTEQNTEHYMALRTRIALSKIDVPRVKRLVEDLKGVKSVPTRDGVRIKLPLTGDGRHCDFAPAVVLALSMPLRDAEAPALNEQELLLAEKQRMLDAAKARYGRKKGLFG